METFLEILREVLEGVMREWSGYSFREKVLENKKTALRRRKQKGWFSRQSISYLTTTTLTVKVAGRSVSALLLFIIFPLYKKVFL